MNKLVIIILSLAPLLGSEVISNVPCDGKYDRNSKLRPVKLHHVNAFNRIALSVITICIYVCIYKLTDRLCNNL